MYDFSNAPQEENDRDRTAFSKAFAGEKLARTALIMSVVSVILSQTVFMSLVTAGVSFMLAVLSMRESLQPRGRTLIAMGLSLLAVIISLYIVVTAVTQVLIPAMTDAAFRQELNRFYMDTYGLNFDELMQPLLQLFGNGN